MGAACICSMQKASDVLGLATDYSADDAKLFRADFDCALHSIYEHRNAVNLFFKYKRPNRERFTAVHMAGNSLWFLGLRSTDQCLDGLPDSNRVGHPLVELTTPEQIKGFRTFLDAAFDIANGG